MLLVRDVPLDFTLHDITSGVGTARRSTLLRSFEMNQMRTRFGQLMKEGLLGEAGAASSMSTRRLTRREEVAREGPQGRYLARRVLASATPRSLSIDTLASPCSTPTRDSCDGELDDAIAPSRASRRRHDLKTLYRVAADTERVMKDRRTTPIMAFLLANSGRSTSPRAHRSWANRSSTARRRSSTRRPVTRRDREVALVLALRALRETTQWN